jgi:hypothetical protein
MRILNNNEKEMHDKLENKLTVEEFKANFEVTDIEWEESFKNSQMNEYGTIDLIFYDEEETNYYIEFDGKHITHIIK